MRKCKTYSVGDSLNGWRRACPEAFEAAMGNGWLSDICENNGWRKPSYIRKIEISERQLLHLIENYMQRSEEERLTLDVENLHFEFNLGKKLVEEANDRNMGFYPVVDELADYLDELSDTVEERWEEDENCVGE